MLTSMITNRNSTMMPPAYTMICTPATNGAYSTTGSGFVIGDYAVRIVQPLSESQFVQRIETMLAGSPKSTFVARLRNVIGI